MKRVFVLLLSCLCVCEVGAKDYFVAIDGDDGNNGSINSPFSTIQHCVNVMSTGDVCNVRSGVYRDKVIIEKSDITIKGYEDEYVVLYGSQQLSGWERYKGNIYRAPVGKLEPQFTQLMFDGKVQQMARYPDNEDGNMFSLDNESGYVQLRTEKDGRVVFDAPLPGDKDFWKGGYFRAVAAKRGATNPQGRIASSEGNIIQCDEMNDIWKSSSSGHQVFKAVGQGDGYIFHLNALSREGEWWCEDGYVYFWQPGGGVPADGSVDVQSLNYVVSINNSKNVRLENLNTRLSAVEFNNCEGGVIDGCTFRDLKGWFYRRSYGHSYREIGGVYINGRNMEVRNSYFTKSWGNLLNLDKGDGVLVDNCIFENNGWMGMFTSSILNNGDNLTVTNCTFGSTGRFHIRSDGHAKLNIQHNDFTDCMKMCQDAGSIELTNSGLLPDAMDMQGSVFAYNKFHNMNTLRGYTNGKQFVAALYFEGAENYTVHHNLCYNISNRGEDGTFLYLGPRYTKIKDCFFYNNTVWNIDFRIKIWNYERDGHKGGIDNMLMYNNIFTSNMINYYGSPVSLEESITIENSVERPLSGAYELFNDTRNDDFTLVAGSEAIDAGQVIPGITDGFKGKAPDVGCYESGVEPWSCGSTLRVREFFPDEDL